MLQDRFRQRRDERRPRVITFGALHGQDGLAAHRQARLIVIALRALQRQERIVVERYGHGPSDVALNAATRSSKRNRCVPHLSMAREIPQGSSRWRPAMRWGDSALPAVGDPSQSRSGANLMPVHARQRPAEIRRTTSEVAGRMPYFPGSAGMRVHRARSNVRRARRVPFLNSERPTAITTNMDFAQPRLRAFDRVHSLTGGTAVGRVAELVVHRGARSLAARLCSDKEPNSGNVQITVTIGHGSATACATSGESAPDAPTRG